MLQAGQSVSVEGPYGRFNFAGGQRPPDLDRRGIGMAPFVARKRALALAPDGRSVDLFRCTAVEDAEALRRLADDAQDAGVRLQLLVDARDGHLTGERLRAAVPDWRHTTVWFCGPARFGQALRADLTAHGLPDGAFHQELFAMLSRGCALGADCASRPGGCGFAVCGLRVADSAE